MRSGLRVCTPCCAGGRGRGGRGVEGVGYASIGHPFGLRAAAAWPRVSVSGVPDRRRCRCGGYGLRVIGELPRVGLGLGVVVERLGLGLGTVVERLGLPF